MCNVANSHYFYGKYERIYCNRPEEVESCLSKIDAAQRAGNYLVGYVSYEAAYCLNDKLLPLFDYDPGHCLVDFYVFEKHMAMFQEEVDCLLAEKAKSDNNVIVYDLNLVPDHDCYAEDLKEIKQYIKDGETYQVNFTGKYSFLLQGDAVSLYMKLRDMQKVEFAALFDCEEFHILSLSPELFFRKQGDYFYSKPMKGTMPRSSDRSIDMQNRNRLTCDPKIIAENMIIVDLIRNDLSVIAERGSVNVPKLFEIEEYETVYQMTSTIACKVVKEMGFSKVISSIFPCGSITGAPKIRTMQIIKELESRNRGIYTGAIGYITPENDMCFNVAIRTIHLDGCSGEMGVGGGIVYDSVISDEYDEIKIKARFLAELPASFNLIECFLYKSKIGFRYLDKHLERLYNSAKKFSFVCSRSSILLKLAEIKKKLDPNLYYKIKVVLQKDGRFDIFYSEVDYSMTPKKIRFSDKTISVSDNILFQHKTDAEIVRGKYNKLFLQANKNYDVFDVIFCNKKGYVTEGSKCNIFIVKNGNIFTPDMSCGLLPGIMRKVFIDEHPQVIQAFLTKQDILTADKILVTNSVIGVMQVECIE